MAWVTETIHATAGTWDLVGLIHWGKNRDWSQNPPAPMPEAPRTYTVHCEGPCLAYEFWSETFLGKMPGDFPVTLAPRQTRIIALRTPSKAGTPQLLGTNRHITMGGPDLQSANWDAANSDFVIVFPGAVGTAEVPFEFHHVLYAPGRTATAASVDGGLAVGAPLLSQVGDVVTSRVSLLGQAQDQSVTLRVHFR
jgi:hypothetical protein